MSVILRPDESCDYCVQEELYSYVTVADEQVFKGMLNKTLDDN